MEANYNIFNQITIREDVPRMYFHKSGDYMFNNKAYDVYGLTSCHHIIIMNYHRRKYIASINVHRANNDHVEIAKMEGSFYEFPKAVHTSKETFFSYELLPFMTGQHEYKIQGESKIVLRTKRLTEEMKKKRSTYLSQQRARHKANINKVCDLLGITESRYNELLFELGLEFIEQDDLAVYADPKWVQQRSFWQWWKNQYYIIDDMLLIKVDIEDRTEGNLNNLLEGKTALEWYQWEHVNNNAIRFDDYVFSRSEKKNEEVKHEA